jgi:hypothetical protein
MAYQLRFLKTSPLSSWLNQTASLLEICTREKINLSPGFMSDDQYRRLVRKALIKGLSSFLVKRSLCDIHLNCDLGLQPAFENKSDDRFEEGVINAPVKRYLFRRNIDLGGAVQKMAQALFEQIPETSFEERKIKLILKDALACHLFENAQCFHHAYCQRSLVQKMDGDFFFLITTLNFSHPRRPHDLFTSSPSRTSYPVRRAKSLQLRAFSRDARE